MVLDGCILRAGERLHPEGRRLLALQDVDPKSAPIMVARNGFEELEGSSLLRGSVPAVTVK